MGLVTARKPQTAMRMIQIEKYKMRKITPDGIFLHNTLVAF